MSSTCLPAEWVEKLFAVMSLRYGPAWREKWRGLDFDGIRADWGKALGEFHDRPHAIQFALDNLPEWPPNASQFRELCRRMPHIAGDQPQLSIPYAKPRGDVPREVAQKLATIATRRRDPRAWAKQLKAMEEAGQPLSFVQRTAWREALRAPQVTSDDEEVLT